MQLAKYYLDRYLPNPLVGVVFFISFVIFCHTAPSLFAEYDIPWHIATGRLIRATMEIPRTDSWSYASNGTPWYNLAWGWDVIISTIVDYLGERSLFNISYLFYSVILATLCYALMSRDAVHEISALIVVFFVGFAIVGFSPGRPQVMTYFLTIIFAIILHSSRTSEKYSKLVLLPCLMLLWVNVHGAFVVGFTIIGAYGLESLLLRQWQWLKRLAFIGALCAAIIFINPYGFDVIHTVSLSTASVINAYIIEWAPFTFNKHIGRNCVFILFMLVTSTANKKVPLADKIISFAWLLMAFKSDRHFPIFAFVAAPYIALNLSNFIKIRRCPDLTKFKYITSVIALMTVMVLITPSVQTKLSINKDSFNYPPLVPLDAINYIKTNYPDKRFYNDYNMGGYLIYYFGGHQQIFIDGRANSAYPEEVMKEVVSFLNYDKNWNLAPDKYKVDGLILYNSDLFHNYYMQGLYRDSWEMVFAGNIASVYMRKGK